MYTFGGGSIGNVWRWNATPVIDQTTGITKPKGYELKPQFYSGSSRLTGTETTSPIPFEQRKKINVIPAGMGGRQEYQWMKGSGDWVEAPQKYTYKTEQEVGKRGGAGFYDIRGNKFSGTLMGTGSYSGFGGRGAQTSQRSWSNYAEPVGPRNPEYSAQNAAESRARMGRSPSLRSGGMGPSDLSAPEEQEYWKNQMSEYYGMTPFAKKEENKTSIFRSGLGNVGLFGSSFPAFPFAGQY